MRFALILTCLAACYSPTPRDCAYACNNETCPSGLACQQGMCREPGATGACTQHFDAGTDGKAIDAVAFDAPTTCTLADIPFVNLQLSDLNGPANPAWTIMGATTFDTNTNSGTNGAPTGTVLNNTLLVYVQSLTVGGAATLTITGSRPLIIAAQDKIDVKGVIRWTPFRGADSNSNCPSSSMSGGAACGGGGAAGGTGGTLGGAGGDGNGTVSGSGASLMVGGQPGMTRQSLMIEPLTLGCQGGSEAGTGGGGSGGGLELVAPTVAISGGIDVAGGGGDAGATSQSCPLGASGGGAGGGLVLNACAVTTTATSLLCAVGGGGGGGGGSTGGTTPAAGAAGDATPSLGLPFGCQAGKGGLAGGTTNTGGDGAGTTNTAATAGGPGAAGGGGGGGTGRIRIVAGFVQNNGVERPNAKVH